MITAKILKDSINSVNDSRLTTFILTYPRFVHAEFMTHRMLSKNSASTRAIPTNKIIQQIKDNPALPEFWGKNQAGMQAYEELDGANVINLHDMDASIGGHISVSTREAAKIRWLEARDKAIEFSEELIRLGLHKQIAGRILEPWFNITIICSGTEWENFFALRAHKDAQPEIRILAEKMLEEYNKSIPEIKVPAVRNGDYIMVETQGKVSDKEFLFRFIDETERNWHLPFGDKMPDGLTKFNQLKVAVARCARLSYLSFDGEENLEKDYAIFDKLLGGNPLHASPGEHIAFPIEKNEFVGNFKGWYQFRKLLSHENANDSRVIKRRVVNGVVI